MKLELKHLVPYLPYRLKCYEPRFNMQHTIIGLVNDEVYIGDEDEIFSFVLDNETLAILRPLSDLTKEIEVNGEKFVPHIKLGGRPNLKDYDIEYLSKNIDNISYGLVSKLIEWHFDVFGLIEKGLAININTINK